MIAGRCMSFVVCVFCLLLSDVCLCACCVVFAVCFVCFVCVVPYLLRVVVLCHAFVVY